MINQLIKVPFLWLSSPMIINGKESNRIAVKDVVSDNKEVVSLYCLPSGHSPEMDVLNPNTNQIERIKL